VAYLLHARPRSSTPPFLPPSLPFTPQSEEEFVSIMKNLNLPYPKKIDDALPKNLVCGS
jgi:hypothetical protein